MFFEIAVTPIDINLGQLEVSLRPAITYEMDKYLEENTIIRLPLESKSTTTTVITVLRNSTSKATTLFTTTTTKTATSISTTLTTTLGNNWVIETTKMG